MEGSVNKNADGLYSAIVKKIGKPSDAKIIGKKYGISVFEDEGAFQTELYSKEKLGALENLKEQFGGNIVERKAPDGYVTYSLENLSPVKDNQKVSPMGGKKVVGKVEDE